MNIQQLPFPKHIGMKHMKTYVLPEDLYVEQWRIPKGTEVKLTNGRDFGYVITPPLGNAKRIFKY